MNGRTLSYGAATAVVSLIFFTWGGLTSLNDVLIPHLKSVFDMNYAQTMLIQSSFFGAYFLMSLPSGRVLAKLGYQRSIVVGLLVAAAGAALFFPAARLPSYPLFLGALFVLASGITLLQVAANPYISLLGDPTGAPSRLNLAQALNSLGTTLFPYLIGPLILSGAVLGATELAALSPAQLAAYRAEEAASVQLPYMVIAGCLLAMAAFVALMRIPPLTEATERADNARHTYREVLSHPHLRWGVLAIFVYVGAEVSIGSFMINYITEPSIGRLDRGAATEHLAYYWGGAMVGRFIGAALLRRYDARRLLALAAVVAIGLLVATMSLHGPLAMWSVLAIGLFNSVMFPTIFTIAIERLGPMTSKASSLLVMAIVGGAIIPWLQGALADHTGLQSSYAIPLLCYAYIVWYGWRGSRLAPSLQSQALAGAALARALH
ncbi:MULTISPECIES: L-fucose:H+ symporter permease [unclassified Lysobacter]|uniref:L-fucose:H+ symporter permease n=1 Tax=unclassified Lysobacter TaxID=2635362 RepID=UPI0006F99BFC|nr:MULTISPECIES: L-fucose:H+ symporter permease [unclassified Lysobacter]KQZ57014.1 MFS transporter [Lysobacter sp. Root559]KRC34855.1 MFS transporter [Lysobacter sp. Root76]KRD70544.1 MFS transporter [Lysobacter sp. Root96]